ncbi:MAG: class I SAM-dependent methyltransferase [Pseudomonadota bacterium]
MLDLGAGTGLFSGLLVVAGRRDLRLCLLDLSSAMLAKAERRFEALGLAVDARVCDYAEDLPTPVDAVISALSIHHLEHATQRALFGRIANALPPGGLFVNAEQVAAPNLKAEVAIDRQWEAGARMLGASDAVITAARHRMRHDRCASTAELLCWLEAAGFTADCPWAGGRFAVLRAAKR